jgi:uncharacterized protein
MHTHQSGFTAFQDVRRIASGGMAEVAAHCKRAIDTDPLSAVLIFEDSTGRQIDLDFRGSLDEVLARFYATDVSAAPPEHAARRGPGRPKLGVVAREVTLLPRHWDWLNSQSGGASVALRKLVEAASREAAPRDRARLALEAVDRFTQAMAGNLPGYEEVMRAFYRNDDDLFHRLTQAWPVDIGDHARRLVAVSRRHEAAVETP